MSIAHSHPGRVIPLAPALARRFPTPVDAGASAAGHPHSTATPVECVICRQPSRRLFERHGHWVLECVACAHRFADFTPGPDHVARVYDNRYFTDGGAGYRGYLRERDLLVARGRRYARLARRFTAPGRMLDVGAAAGFTLVGFRDAGWEVAGVEPNATLARHAREVLGAPVHTSPLEAFQTPERFDLISMLQVVAHFYDVREALERAASLTKPGGVWIVETWDRGSAVARCLGESWHQYNPPSVLHFFSTSDIARLLGRFGLREVARGRPAKWLIGAHAKAVLRHHGKGTRAGRIAERLARWVPDDLPVPYPAFDLTWSVFRKWAGPGE
jgi:SAM-dependent methyltransferase